MTPQQHKLLGHIRDYVDQHGYAPTYEQMATFMGLASKGGIARLVDALTEQGLIIRTQRSRHRNIELPTAALATLTSVPTSVLEAELARRMRHHG